MDNLTKFQLKQNLEILKQILSSFEKHKFYNICFINIDAFYYHLDLYNKTNFETKNIIKNIEKYIPIKNLIDAELMGIYEAGIHCNNIDELNYFKSIFYKKAVMKFLYLIKKCETYTEWLELLKSCENMIKTV